jgi:hypothetical protein
MKASHVLKLEDLIMLRSPFCSADSIYKYSADAIKNPSCFSVETDKSILKFIWKHKKPRLAKTK